MSKFYGRISRRKLLSVCSQIDSEGNPNSRFKNAPASRAIAFFDPSKIDLPSSLLHDAGHAVSVFMTGTIAAKGA
jgi:hypothetical protein